jgi:hypothetical protein
MELDVTKIPRLGLLRPCSLPILNFSLILESMNVMPQELQLDQVFLSLSAPVSASETLPSEIVLFQIRKL